MLHKFRDIVKIKKVIKENVKNKQDIETLLYLVDELSRRNKFFKYAIFDDDKDVYYELPEIAFQLGSFYLSIIVSEGEISIEVVMPKVRYQKYSSHNDKSFIRKEIFDLVDKFCK